MSTAATRPHNTTQHNTAQGLPFTQFRPANTLVDEVRKLLLTIIAKLNPITLIAKENGYAG